MEILVDHEITGASTKSFFSRPHELIQGKITGRCLQLFGGYGYMEQYHPISRMYRDARVARIYVRTNEFMKVPIAGFAGRSP